MKMVIIFKNVNVKVKKVFNYFYKRKHSKTLVQSLERPKILFSLNTCSKYLGNNIPGGTSVDF